MVITLGEKRQSWSEELPTEEDMKAIESDAERQAMAFGVQVGILEALREIASEMKRVNDYVMGGDKVEPGPEPADEMDKAPALSDPAEKVVQIILKVKPQMGRDTLVRLIEEERKRAGGLLTEEAAAHMVAQNLGVFGEEPASRTTLPENVKDEAQISEFYKQVLREATTREGEPLPQDVLDSVEVAVGQDVVELRHKWMGGDQGKMWFAVIGGALRQYGGEWVRDASNSHWRLSHPSQ